MDWNALNEALEMRIEHNYHQFMDEMMRLDRQELILKAGIINDTQKVYEEVKKEGFDTEEAIFLIRYVNPLEVLRKEFYRDDLELDEKVFIFYDTDSDGLKGDLERLDKEYELVEALRLPDCDDDEIIERFLTSLENEIRQYITGIKINSASDLATAAETLDGMKRIRNLMVKHALDFGLYLPDMRQLIRTANPLYSLYQVAREKYEQFIFFDEILSCFNEPRIVDLFSVTLESAPAETKN